MTATELLTHLKRLDVQIWAEGDRLRISAPKGVVTSEMRAELAKRKAELIALLPTLSPGGLDGSIPRRARTGAAPLAFAQEGLWFLEQLQPGMAAYNIADAVHLRGALNVAALEQALATIVMRHETLRTTFRLMDDRPVQVVSPAAASRLSVVDLAGATLERQEEAVKARALAEARQPFDLAVGPLFRAILFRLAPDDYVLLTCMHHIISDGWSLGILARELGESYQAYVQGHAPALPELPIQYPDYAEWQRGYLQGAVLDQELAYWRGKLAGVRPVELPIDRPRPTELSFAGAQHRVRLPATLTGQLRELARHTDTTFFMVLLAGFKGLLARYTGQDEVAVGSPIAGRNRRELEGLIGCFVDTLVLRTDLAGEPTVRELLARVRETCLGAYAHQEVPFEKLVEDLRPERDLSRNPLFQVMLVLQNFPRQTLNLAGVTLKPAEWDRSVAHFDLTLYLRETTEGLEGLWEYNTDLFDAATIARMAGHFQTLLAGIVADPDQRLAALPLLTDAERAQVAAWNATAREDPQACVHDGIAAQAARAPERVAVVGARSSLTYRELEARAERLAGHLRSLGVGPDRRVGVCLERTPEMVVAVLAVLKAGGAYVPLDPAYPAARLAYMSEDAGLTVLISQRALVAAVPTRSVRLVLVDEPAATWGHAAGPAASREHLAYVIYTSGSTGQPKGVPITHRALGNLLTSMAREPGFTATDALLAVTTLSFDIAALELFLPLSTGGTVVVATRDQAADGVELQALLATAGVTVMQATPATWRLLLEAGWTGTPGLKILCGGEAVPRDLANSLLARAAEVWNVYGPTETTIWSSAGKVAPGEGPVSIGRPIANTQMYVLDGHRNPLPAGVPGELYIGGTGLSPGYWNRPDLTAERFVADPFSADPGARLYRTGDRARWRPDGTIECLGRVDHQVKIRGFRIELGEIEAALARVDGVAQAVVVARDDTPGEKHLVAYVVPTIQQSGPSVTAGDLPVDGVPLRAATLRATLRVTLPDYMLPTSFVFLDALPRTPNGKVDRTALPRPDRTPDLLQPYEAPVGGTEEKLAGILASLLKVPRVGRNDSFFDLGGHSILAVSFFHEIERAFGPRLPLATLFRAPTVEAIAAMIETELRQPRAWSSLVPIQATGARPHFFCVHGAGGNVLLYRDLARRLGGEYPFYGLQSQGLDGKAPPLTTVEEMAAKYVSEIIEFQPEGPYCLGGYCLGGKIAYEMAQILSRNGHDVALLVLMDSYNLTDTRQPRLLGYLRQKMVFHLRNLAHMEATNWAGYLKEKMRVARDGELLSIWKNLRDSVKGIGSRQDRPPTAASLQEVNDRAAAIYSPKPYSGRVTLVKPRANYEFLPDPNMGWGDLALGGLDLVEVAANPHAMLVEPYVNVLATELMARLRKVQSAVAPGSWTGNKAL